MKAEFWLERWESGRTGFHQSEPNRYLVNYWNHLNLGADSKVLVPLCGKSGDMTWLREQGHSVLGVELCEIAVRDFFAENDLVATQKKHREFDRWDGDDVTLLCGDVFRLSAADLGEVNAVYDRAALIALPPEMRKDYANLLRSVLPKGTKILLVTIAYPQDQREGPPFSVSDDEVNALFADGFEVTQLVSEDVLSENGRFQGSVDYLNENAYLIKKTS